MGCGCELRGTERVPRVRAVPNPCLRDRANVEHSGHRRVGEAEAELVNSTGSGEALNRGTYKPAQHVDNDSRFAAFEFDNFPAATPCHTGLTNLEEIECQVSLALVVGFVEADDMQHLQ